jgi:beta propeller repeat protein
MTKSIRCIRPRALLPINVVFLLFIGVISSAQSAPSYSVLGNVAKLSSQYAQEQHTPPVPSPTTQQPEHESSIMPPAWPFPSASPMASVLRASVAAVPMLQEVHQLDHPLAVDFSISALPRTSEESPSIDGAKVIWYDDRTQGPTDVWGYDFSTGQEFQVTSHPVAQFISDISGEIVAYEDNRNGTWDIYATRLSTGEEFAVATGPHHQRYPRVWDDYIVYQDETGDYWQSNVYLYQISTGFTTPLAVASGFQGDPDIDDGWMVWRDNRTGPWQARAYHLPDNTYHILDPGNCNGELRQPRIGGGLVVWQNDCISWPDPGYDIYGYDLAADKLVTIYSGPGQQERPVVSDQLIAWQDQDTYGNWNVFVYVRSSGALFPVSLEPSRQQQPAVFGNTVVWQDNRSHTWDIYGLVWDGVGPPNSTPVLQNPRALHAGAYPGGEIRLSWTDNVTNELGFVLQRSIGILGTGWEDYATLPSGTAAFVDTTTEVGESYWYRVKAYNLDGSSSYSNESYSTAFDNVPNLDERYVHLLINEARMAPGTWGYPSMAPVNPLGWDPNLAYSARTHALGMNNSNCCQGHVDLAGRGPSERAYDSGYPYGTGENLFQAVTGRAGMESAHQGFMDSEGHRNNIMAADLKQTAIGFAPGGRGTLVEVFSGGPYTTMVPALPSGIVVPYSGPVETTYAYLVSFWNPGLTAPASATVVIDGARHAMTLRNGQPGRGTYIFSTNLPLGDHTYRFEFTWGAPLETARLPINGDFSGPFVREHMPDLLPGRLRSDKLVAGYEGHLSTWVQNTGELPATNVAVKFYQGDPSHDGIQIGATQIVTEILSQQGANVQAPWTPLAAGTYTISVLIDPDNQIAELDEQNNVALGDFLVRDAHLTWYVDTSVISSGDGLTPATAFRTIGEACPYAYIGDTIRVAPGTYHEQITVPTGVTLMGNTYANTILDAAGLNGPVVYLNPDSGVENFTITGSGPGYFDTGIWLDSGTATVRHNRITGNSAGIWGWCFDPSHCEARLLIEYNIIDGNTSNAVNSNEIPILLVDHNTIVGNGGSGVILNNANSLATNNIIASNESDGLVNNVGATVHHNDAWGNRQNYNGGEPGEGGLSIDPMLRDAAHADYRLFAGSPAVSSGTPTGTDMGALPFVPAREPPTDVRHERTGATDWTVSWTGVTAQGYYLYIGTTAPGLYSNQVDAGSTTSYILSNLPIGLTYYVAVSAYDANRDESRLSSEFAVIQVGYRLFLPAVTH